MLGFSGHEPCGLGDNAHPARLPTIAAIDHAIRADGQCNKRKFVMGLILLEALLALVLLVAIVWWTMFSGRSKGELRAPPDASDEDKP
jgi:disulfide bond formation protein DsbB